MPARESSFFSYAASPGGIIRSSDFSRAMCLMFTLLQTLFGLRGVNRVVKLDSSSFFLIPSIHP
jgi:hypothetical protein